MPEKRYIHEVTFYRDDLGATSDQGERARVAFSTHELAREGADRMRIRHGGQEWAGDWVQTGEVWERKLAPAPGTDSRNSVYITPILFDNLDEER